MSAFARAVAPLASPLAEPRARHAIVGLVEAGQQAEREARHVDARAAYERALRLGAGAVSGVATASALLRWIARTHHAEGHPDVALEVLTIARLAAGDDVDVDQADNLHAGILFQQGALDEAEALWRGVRAAAVRRGDAGLAAMTSNNLAVLANIRGDFAFALDHYEMALADYRALGMVRDVCRALNNLGMLQTRLQRWDAAAAHYAEALAVARSLGDREMELLLRGNGAVLAIAREDFEAARIECGHARALIADAPDAPGAGEVERISGVIERECGDHDSAEAHFALAARLADRHGALLLAAETARERAELYRRQGRNAAMLQQLNLAHALFQQLRARRDLADVDRRNALLEAEFLELVRRWGSSIESKDRYTQGHCERVAAVASALAERAGLDQRSLFWFRVGALLHDVGKLLVPPGILNKVGKLDADEWAQMRRHPQAGVELLAEIDFPWDVAPIVLSHHERWDGTGYPHGLAGEEIPFTARILAIADVYDALTTARSYKPAFSQAEALDIMRGESGTQFDPALLAMFEQLCADGLPVVPERDEPTGQVAAA